MQYWQRVSNPPALTSIPAPPDGHPPLVAQLLARRYTYDALAHDTTDGDNGDNNDSSIHTIDLLRNVTVTVGASQALFLALQCVIQQSDEVVLLMEPFFDLYQNQVLLAGGVPVYVPLLEFQPYNEKDSGRGGTWVLHEDTLLSKVTSNTKAILLNSPHNPTGKLFLRKEMEMIASAVVECAHPECIVLSDEVYKYIVHAPPLHSTTSTTRPLRSPATFILPHYPARGIVHTHHFVGGKDLFSYRLASRMVYRSPQVHRAYPTTLTVCAIQFCASTIVQEEALARSLVAADGPYHGYPSYYACVSTPQLYPEAGWVSGGLVGCRVGGA